MLTEMVFPFVFIIFQTLTASHTPDIPDQAREVPGGLGLTALGGTLGLGQSRATQMCVCVWGGGRYILMSLT